MSKDMLKARFDEAAAALRDGHWSRARDLALALLADLPSHAGIHFIAGAAAFEMQQGSLAIELLSRAAELDPARPDHQAQLSRALVSMHRFAEASVAAARALALAPRDPATLGSLGLVFSQLHEHAKAAELFRRVVELRPRSAGDRFNLATALVFIGDPSAAESELETCLELDPGFWKAYPALSQLRTQTVERNHVPRLLAMLPVAAPQGAASYLHVAVAKELEDLADYPRAFEHLAAGKALIRSRKGYSFARDEALFASVQDAFTSPGADAAGHPANEPIFVFGMPRSGTTLVERILSSHPDVHAAGELENFGVALKRASGSTTAMVFDQDTVSRATRLDWARLGADYLQGTRPGTGRTPRFVDKLPQNFFYAGYIAKALPLAKMICVRRDPMDTCLGNFRQLFAQQSSYYDYSLDILDIGRYYIHFDRLMRHWESLFPGRILTVQYEHLVAGQEEASRQLLAFCELAWDDACLRFEDNPAPVSSASTLQVRRAMHADAIGRWKNYEPQLRPLRRLLEGAGISVTD
jgi:tetratricopeptide (TPR) repeat protein